jgi:hypothetical protein
MLTRSGQKYWCYDEEEFTRLEEERQAALEMAQEENATPKAGTEDEKAVKLTDWGYGVVRYPRGLQLIGDDC